MPRKYKLIISDLHIGTGQAPGHLNPWESFGADDKLAEFLKFYSTDFFEDEDVELILNGDFYDFLLVKVDGQFPDQVTERMAVAKIQACMDGHPKVHRALAEFIRTPHKHVTVIPGNHDFDWVFPKAQEAFCERLCGTRTDPRVQFICDREYYQFDGIQVHHGMQFEPAQYHNFREQFLTNNGSEPILNMPWGSIFIVKVLSRLKEERPYIDKIRPFWAYLVRAIFFDPIFALKVLVLATVHFVKTRLLSFRHFRARLRQTWLMMRETEVYPDLAHKVKHVFDHHPEVHTIILGHTHIPLVRRFEGDRQYVNTGCWTSTISLEMDSFGRESKLTYAFIEYGAEGARPTIALREWRGYHDIYRDILF
jgi:UDP-2,3-diacylglucosamine pyrophosphatase LpxH